MTSTPRFTRALLAGAVLLALASASAGCSWFKNKSNYEKSVETQPLEVPPGLDLPDTSLATTLPPVGGANRAPAASGTDLQLAGSASDAYPKIGAALEGIAGVVINGRAEALGSYDVSYQGQNFLVRVQDSASGGSRLMALSPDGRILTGGPAAALMAAIKAKL
jgi:uncharacterized lipoprotein